MTVRQTLLFLISLSAIAIASTSHALLPQQEVDAENFPSTVAVVFIKNLSRCTAVKVAPKIFLTAAHCFASNGAGDEIAFEQVSKGQILLNIRAQISRLQVEKFESATARTLKYLTGDLYDLALFKTDIDLDIPIAKINYHPVPAGLKILIGGYGNQDLKACYATYHACSLNMASQEVTHTDAHIFESKPSRRYPHYLTKGDSGGPVYIYNSQSKQLEVVGINSLIVPTGVISSVEMLFLKKLGVSSKAAFVRLEGHSAWLKNILREMIRD